MYSVKVQEEEYMNFNKNPAFTTLQIKRNNIYVELQVRGTFSN